jgi:hypothetical protein
MLELKKITLVSIVTRLHASGRAAIDDMLSKAKFNGVVVFTDQPEHFKGIGYFIVEPREYRQWCIWRMTELPKQRSLFTSHILFVESDSAIVKPAAWTDAFLEYDYIGAPWLDSVVGNGGFCLVSHRLLAAIEALNVPATETACFPSDYKICRVYRRWLENHGIRFAPLKVAQQFSSEQGPYTNSLGVHSYRDCQQQVINEHRKI